MKLIEALKKIQDLERKADDLREKVFKHAAHLNVETPVYPDQMKQVDDWIQAHHDILKEIERLRLCIQKTNMETPVTINLNGNMVTKSIAAWIHRRRDLAAKEHKVWAMLTDRNLKEGTIKQSTGQEVEVNIFRCYRPKERYEKLDLYRAEPNTIDSTLEVVNAVTDLIED